MEKNSNAAATKRILCIILSAIFVFLDFWSMTAICKAVNQNLYGSSTAYYVNQTGLLAAVVVMAASILIIVFTIDSKIPLKKQILIIGAAILVTALTNWASSYFHISFQNDKIVHKTAFSQKEYLKEDIKSFQLGMGKDTLKVSFIGKDGKKLSMDGLILETVSKAMKAQYPTDTAVGYAAELIEGYEISGDTGNIALEQLFFEKKTAEQLERIFEANR